MNATEKKIRKLVGDFDPTLPPPTISAVPEGVHRPKWSVMIPTFNCANYLRETLESVLAQDLGPDQMQIEVVDDCSTKDDPESVVREVGKGRVQFYRKPKNEGAIPNFNTCIERSRGELVHTLHGDDFILPNFYQEIENLVKKSPDCSLYAARCYYAQEDGVYSGITPRLKNFESDRCHELNQFIEATPFQFAGVAIRRAFYERNGGFDPRLVHTADWEMWTRVVSRDGGIISPNVLGVYRMFDANDTGRLMRTAENLRDRERLAIILASRNSKISFKKINNHNIGMSINQQYLFQSMGDKDAVYANREFRNQRASLWMNISQSLIDLRYNLGIGTKIRNLLGRK